MRLSGPSEPAVTCSTGTAAALVAVGGAVGATARWGLESAAPPSAGAFPWTTFAINVAGSFLLALLAGTVPRHRRLGGHLTVLLGPGLLGGFTTLSATSEEGRLLIGSGHLALAAAYLLGTVLAALAAVTAAGRLTRGSPRTSR